MPSLRERIAGLILGNDYIQSLSPVTSQVDDSPGWTSLSGRPHDLTTSEVQEQYDNSLKAWRKNPIAFRIISITSDYVVGDEIIVSSPNKALQKFGTKFWNHPKNRFDLRLEPMCDELSRSGDLFVLLFRNAADGMSYIRFVTKDRIQSIDLASNDWETELAYHETQESGDPKIWYSPSSPESENAEAVMLHYSINRPIGTTLGSGDLTTITPWLMRYSRMLEDRVRLNWAVRAFLWVVTVPSSKVKTKTEQYRRPPDAGSIIVKDESETWEVMAPLLRAADAQHDLKSVRGIIDAGSGYPPHWRGEAEPANLATARAMTAPTERHLIRRQKYFHYMLMDIVYTAYQRAYEIQKVRRIADTDYDKLFIVTASDLSRSDNESLAKAARDITQAFYSLSSQLGVNETYAREILRLSFKFAGEPISETKIDEILSTPIYPPVSPGQTDDPDVTVPKDDIEIEEVEPE